MPNHTIDEVLGVVQAANTRVDSLIALFSETKKKLDEALANTTIPAEVQAKIDQIFDIDTAQAKKLDTALNSDAGKGALPPPPELPNRDEPQTSQG